MTKAEKYTDTSTLYTISGDSQTLSNSVWKFSQSVSSVAQSSLTLCDPMDCSTPGFPVHHQLPRACSNSCPSSRWCHPTISSSVIPFPSSLQSLLASGSFPMSQLFTSGGQSIGASASVLPMNIQDWFPLGWTGWISLQSKGLSRIFSITTVSFLKWRFSDPSPGDSDSVGVCRVKWKLSRLDTELVWGTACLRPRISKLFL